MITESNQSEALPLQILAKRTLPLQDAVLRVEERNQENQKIPGHHR
ncbi:hypothetical protein [Bacillus infantis]|nr:hypothetical protein [Bacillus infantis]